MHLKEVAQAVPWAQTRAGANNGVAHLQHTNGGYMADVDLKGIAFQNLHQAIENRQKCINLLRYGLAGVLDASNTCLNNPHPAVKHDVERK